VPTKFHRIIVRPTTEVNFPIDPPEFTKYIEDTYISTGKCLEHRAASYSEDNLIKTYTSSWINEEAFNEALLDLVWVENAKYITDFIADHNLLTFSWTE
jgi:hypothetical protein